MPSGAILRANIAPHDDVGPPADPPHTASDLPCRSPPPPRVARPSRALALALATATAAALLAATGTAERAAGADGDPFTIVAIPDTQNYTYLNRQGTMTQQTQWVVDTRDELDTAFVAQLGDLVSEEENLTQWGHTSTAFRVLDDAGVPHSVVPGNHDFDNATGAIHPFHDFFPPSRYAGADWTPATSRYGGYLGQNQFGVDPVDRGNFDSYSLFTAGGTDFLVLNLEWEAPQYALDWADRVLDAHPDRTVIMATHSFVSITGNRRTTAERPGGTSPAAMWSSFVSTHCRIRLVLSGHEHDGDAGENRRDDLNSCGEPVHQILTDYQDRANGGDGWLRYYTFDPAADTMTATTYSPKLGQYETDADSSFTVPFVLGDPPPPEPEPTVFSDTFTRSRASGWGDTDTGESWTLSGAASSYSVDGSRGRITLAPGSGRIARLADLSLADTSITFDAAVAPAATGSGVYVTALSRLNGTTSYRAKVRYEANGVVSLYLTRYNGSETTLTWARVPGSFAPNTSVRLLFETSGTSPTTLRAKAWNAASAEPASWLLSTTDSTAVLQAPGAVGIDTYQSGSAAGATTIAFDRYVASVLGGTPPPPPPPPPPVNVAPTVVIAPPTVVDRTVTVSGVGSSDTDGTIAAYAWTFGDGTNAPGATATRTYAADGTFTITLTVTDDDGATASATRSVTVAAPPPPPPPPPTGVLGSDDFARTVSNGWGAADAGGAWTTRSSAGRYAVAGGVGQHRLTAAGSNADTLLTGASGTATQLSASVSFSRTAASGTLYASLVPRAVSTGNDYRLRVMVRTDGRPVLIFVRTIGGAETVLGSVTLTTTTVTAGSWYAVTARAVPSGTGTSLTAKLWPRGTTEPGWQLTSSDATPALQSAGYVQLNSYQSGSATAGVTTSWDEVRVTTAP